MEESLKTDVLEICTNACEKYVNDNQSVSIIINNPIPNGPNWVQFQLSWQHNVHLVQFEFLPTEQAKTYLYYLDFMSSYTT